MEDVCNTKSIREDVIPKDSEEIWAVGSVDEANAFLGLAKVSSRGKTREILEYVQKKMFYVGAEVSSGNRMIFERDVAEISRMIEEVIRDVSLPNSFVVLEQNTTTALLSVARTVVRRAERWLVRLHRDGKIGSDAIRWINKLSYLLYILTLYELGGEYEVVRFEERD